MLMSIYVPMEGSAAANLLLPKSAVVGDAKPDDESLVDCHYEGQAYQQSNLHSYYSRLACAAGRRLQRYPTSARMSFHADQMVAVGLYDAARQVVTELTRPDLLEAYAGESVESIMGRRVPAGRVAWSDAAGLAQPPHSHPIGTQHNPVEGLWFRTQAGQVVRFGGPRMPPGDVEVFDHDDPRLPGLMERLELSDGQRRLVFG